MVYACAMKKFKLIESLYNYALVIRGVDGLVDLFFAGLLSVTSTQGLTGLVLRALSREFIEDPNDFVANWLLNFAKTLSVDAHLFIVLYLLGNGMLKVFLFFSLWFKKQWMYLPAFVFLILFIVYQGQRLLHSFSWTFFLLMLFDVFIAYMVFGNYRVVLRAKRRE